MTTKEIKLKKPNNPQMRSYAEALKRGRTSPHVIPSTNGWAVKSIGTKKAKKKFQRQAEAVNYAKKLAQKRGADLFVHGSDGRIRERTSYYAGKEVHS